MTRGDGRTIWVLDKGHLVRDEEGAGYFCCVLVDVTRSKELEEKLRIFPGTAPDHHGPDHRYSF